MLAIAVAVIPLIPGGVSAHDAHLDETPEAKQVRTLLRLPAFRAVLVVSALVYGSHALYDAFAVIRWSDAGLSAPVISLLWAEAVAAEVLVFFVVGPWLLNRLGARAAAIVAAVAGTIRWSIMGFTTSIGVLALLQPLHGLSFALLHLACMRVMAEIVRPRLAGTAQATYAFSPALVTAALTSVSGTLYARYGGEAFVGMAVLCLIALPLAWYGLPDVAGRSTRFNEKASRFAERL